MNTSNQRAAQGNQFDDSALSSDTNQRAESCVGNNNPFLLCQKGRLQAVVYDYSRWGEVDPATMKLMKFYRAADVPVVAIMVGSEIDEPPSGLTVDEAMGYQQLLVGLKAEIEQFAEQVADGMEFSGTARMKIKVNLERIRKIEEVLKHGR